MPDRVRIPRAAAEQLRAISIQRDLADAEASGLLAGLCHALGISRDEVAGVDDGDEPALLLAGRPAAALRGGVPDKGRDGAADAQPQAGTD
jgi:hypothetical protein